MKVTRPLIRSGMAAETAAIWPRGVALMPARLDQKLGGDMLGAARCRRGIVPRRHPACESTRPVSFGVFAGTLGAVTSAMQAVPIKASGWKSLIGS